MAGGVAHGQRTGREVRLRGSDAAQGVPGDAAPGHPEGRSGADRERGPVACGPVQDGAEGGADAESPEQVEVRCPVGRGGILLKLLRTGAATIGEGNLIEVACVECRRVERQGGREVLLVLHRFGMDGEHVETVTV
jgi:hypothetical protein